MCLIHITTTSSEIRIVWQGALNSSHQQSITRVIRQRLLNGHALHHGLALPNIYTVAKHTITTMKRHPKAMVAQQQNQRQRTMMTMVRRKKEKHQYQYQRQRMWSRASLLATSIIICISIRHHHRHHQHRHHRRTVISIFFVSPSPATTPILKKTTIIYGNLLGCTTS